MQAKDAEISRLRADSAGLQADIRAKEVQLTEVRTENKAQASEIRAKQNLMAVSSQLASEQSDRAFTESERARVLEVHLTEVRGENKAQASEITRLQTELARRDAQPAAVTLPQLQQHVDCLQQILRGQVVGGVETPLPPSTPPLQMSWPTPPPLPSLSSGLRPCLHLDGKM